MTKSQTSKRQASWTAVDLFSGAGGMSFGFHAHPKFQLVAAVDMELGKPSDGFGALECNKTYLANLAIKPIELDLAAVKPVEIGQLFRDRGISKPDVLLACPPCTGFSRAVAQNHVVDDPRNMLVPKTAEFVRELKPAVVVMENARELINGKFRHHYNKLQADLAELGYSVNGKVFRLDRFGLPQVRERVLLVATKRGLHCRNLDDLWTGFAVRDSAKTVRAAIEALPSVRTGESHVDDPAHVSTRLDDELSMARIVATPVDGGSWADLLERTDAERLLIPSMWAAVRRKRMNSYCDIYGRMWWDRPAPTIKRECCHPGNGRYLHPRQHRLCTVRELAILQGFPGDYRFVARSRKNMYRHVGDAVPPLISHQLAHLVAWILSNKKPDIRETVLPGTHLSPSDIQYCRDQLPLFAVAK